jgi:hypothetical protein
LPLPLLLPSSGADTATESELGDAPAVAEKQGVAAASEECVRAEKQRAIADIEAGDAEAAAVRPLLRLLPLLSAARLRLTVLTAPPWIIRSNA